MDYSELIEQRKTRLEELETLMAKPNFYDNETEASEKMRHHRNLSKLISHWNKHEKTSQEITDCQSLLEGSDEEMSQLAKAELPKLEKQKVTLFEEIQYALLPRDEAEDRDALLEIRAGAGGDEASLFAGTLLRLYERFSENQNWKVECLSSTPSEVGGFKEVVLKVKGNQVFRFLKYESGVHRVQRIPSTETQGRIHTSTASVAVLPEAEEVDIVFKPEDLHIQATRSGGPGGQHVNTTDSAVQITHLPTGLQVKCQDGRSQHQNKDKALEILRAKLFEKKHQEQTQAYSAQRKALIGSADRSEKIRTYNFPQSRVTDHRISYTSHHLDGILNGEIDEFIEALQKTEMAEKLKEAATNH